MASSPLVFNTAKQLILLLIITILTLSLILWLTELETIHCADELLDDTNLLASLPSEFYLSTNSSSPLSTTSLLSFSSTFRRAASSSSPTRFPLKLESPLLIVSNCKAKRKLGLERIKMKPKEIINRKDYRINWNQQRVSKLTWR